MFVLLPFLLTLDLWIFESGNVYPIFLAHLYYYLLLWRCFNHVSRSQSVIFTCNLTNFNLLWMKIKSNLFLSIFSVANWTPKLGNESFVKSELDRAFGVWSDYSRLKFRRIEKHKTADIVILFGRYQHGD